MRQYVGVVLLRSDGSFVAQHRDNIPNILGPDTWAVPGGAMEDTDETVEDAAVREYTEETDYVIDKRDLRFLTKDEYVTERGMSVERIIFTAMYDETQDIHCNEGQEIRFVEPNELNTLNFYTGHQAFFKKASESIMRSHVEKS